ncbi:hypothetical protein SERLADRAFT_353365 [Serpula lacrymans var. lacrymans S7.9]|uniref:ABC transporter n=1 Tax=Serpula lacrymans var. lacrymans (strain S7.9) TaxID=578457 RepID=F8PEJ2_SERL9|nr:uncharacterized protein SERLADRAFT_353365 [Serpula lacrymans var. lacrymans S7.9]EGO18443.1 hypothetical protein SERLADRAFT_353365 [Serpula lacrymans var. lacrymans S7.9]
MSLISSLCVSKDPPPPKSSLDEADITPEVSASWLSLLWFGWMTPLLSLGHMRPLEATDLYKLPHERTAAQIADKILASFDERCKRADEYNVRLTRGDIGPGLKGLWWSATGNRVERERQWRENDGKRQASLVLAINDSIKWWFWSAGILKVMGDTAQVTSPLVAIVIFATESYVSHFTGAPVPSIGVGIGLSFVLLALQVVNSWCTHHFYYRSMSSGVLVRGGLIAAIYSRSLRLSGRARSTLSNGKLVNHISTDVSRIDFCLGYFHMSWSAPIQLVICLILLLVNLGPSALAGFAVFVVVTPLQSIFMTRLFTLRRSSMQWTDKRSKLLQELLSGIKVIKFFAWEIPFLKRVSSFRREEMGCVHPVPTYRAGLSAMAMSLPVLSSVVAFITYSLAGHTLNAAIIFSSLALFQLIMIPLMFLPMSLSTITDAHNAVIRLRGVFEAEMLDETVVIDNDLDVAIRVQGASFSWDSSPKPGERGQPKGFNLEGESKTPAPTADENNDDEEKIFKLTDIDFSIPRGQLCAIVGAVGAGKTSLLQGLVGEMRPTAGSVAFGGTVGYCAQTAWIQNTTIRENICFGRPFEEQRYWKAIRDACLEPDLEMLPNGDLTEVGEKGISLSGGQKQRINICRSIYCDTDIQIFDDPLSALDAHVGKDVFQNVLKGNLEGKTRVLVTHALHFLPQVDYIYTLLDGRIAERGTYSELMANDGAFSKFVCEFGSSDKSDDSGSNNQEKVEGRKAKGLENAVPGKAIMKEEERNTGAIGSAIYGEFFRAGNGLIIAPLLLISVILMEGCSVMSSYWLVYWQERKWPQSQGFYMGIYAGIGISQALSSFLMGTTFAFFVIYASQALHGVTIKRVLYAPMSFFETTPLGRIMNRFTKDMDTLDNMLGDSMRLLVATGSSALGSIILISVIVPWFLIAVAAVSVCYFYAALFYRSSARELKIACLSNLILLDAILRSSLYSHFSESLSGLTTIRAYGEIARFQAENEKRVDIENRHSVSCSPNCRVENDMNAVERIVHYANQAEQEPPHQLDACTLSTPWLSEGQVEMKDVVLKYRPELPPVLKGLSMSIKPGEKIGIVGRTGAGKSSIMTALFRIVELESGCISIDGVDISSVGLMKLRSGLSIIPQEAVISGTLRSNLDPFELYDDAKLWDALKRSYLVEPSKESLPEDTLDEKAPVARFNLDSPIDEEGNNLSVGQRSLVSLARALVNDTKVLILDEATASVDYETDRKIQETIMTEFKDRTILCIAHRLRTIISYDRICVLDGGRIAEFDTPSTLYSIPNSIFREMCDHSSISLDDIMFGSKRMEVE